MNIIKTDIIKSAFDVFWEAAPAITSAVSRPVLIVIKSYEKNSPEEMQLQKMLEACRLNPEQYNIVQLTDEQNVAWHKLRECFDPKIVFMIGILPVQLGISASFRLNEPNNFNDRTWLPTIALDELEQSKEAKGQLWNKGMKPLFIERPLPASDARK